MSGCTNLGCQVAMATKFYTVAPNICGCSIQNFIHVTLLVPRILVWFLDFWKTCVPLVYLGIW